MTDAARTTAVASTEDRQALKDFVPHAVAGFQ